jgi:S-disulfanyl-L-cysteine oxidoreductase SoxD
MRPKENYSRYLVAGLILSVAVLVSFQVYILREPQRIAAVSNEDKTLAVAAGQQLFKDNCVTCHGANGEGDIGPALNDSTFLKTTADNTIFSVISSGVPGTQMPAWNQQYGGPLTDENVTQLVAFLKSWQATAPDLRNAPLKGDSGNGIVIFNSVCATCHGANGIGIDKTPALNDGTHLSQFDDAWYKDTIMKGRPAKGMPTWGTVLAPQQIADLLALIDEWRASPATSLTPTPPLTSTVEVTPTVDVARPSNPGGPGAAIGLTADLKAGEQIFTDSCKKCHGDQGVGGVANPGSTDGTIPPLNPIDETLIDSNPTVYATNLDLFIEHGSTPEGPNPKESMPAWGDTKKLTPQQIADVIGYVMSLNPAPTAATSDVARPSNPGGPGPAVALTGDVAIGTQLFTDNCQKCHGPQGTGGVANPGSTDGTIPPLNPIDETLIDPNPSTYATNLDLFLEHGSTPEGPNPKETMPAWGDSNKLTPQQIADLIAYVMSLNPAPTASVTPTPEATPPVDVARPSNPGGPGAAIGLTADLKAGEQIFTDSCKKCHGDQGAGGVANPGSTDGTIPPLSPIDETLIDPNPTVYATNLDLFLEHGSMPEGPNPKETMPAWGDTKKLTPQQIADVIGYVMSLNPAPAAAPTETPTPSAEATSTVDVARPSNPGDAGPAVALTGDVKSGEQLFGANCEKCHGPTGTGGVANPGSTDGTIPPLKPIDETLIDSNPSTYATNLDLFLEHGSTPEGPNPKQNMPAWGDTKKLTPQQIADLIAYVMSLNPAPAAASDVARPSNPGDAGPALNLTGDALAGATVFTDSCKKCHGDQGVGGVANPGSTDGTIPPLNPIDDTMISKDLKVFAYNIDLFVEHGSSAEGPNPKEKMPAWGDTQKLTPQQIADVIAYLISLNTGK